MKKSLFIFLLFWAVLIPTFANTSKSTMLKMWRLLEKGTITYKDIETFLAPHENPSGFTFCEKSSEAQRAVWRKYGVYAEAFYTKPEPKVKYKYATNILFMPSKRILSDEKLFILAETELGFKTVFNTNYSISNASERYETYSRYILYQTGRKYEGQTLFEVATNISAEEKPFTLREALIFLLCYKKYLNEKTRLKIVCASSVIERTKSTKALAMLYVEGTNVTLIPLYPGMNTPLGLYSMPTKRKPGFIYFDKMKDAENTSSEVW